LKLTLSIELSAVKKWEERKSKMKVDLGHLKRHIEGEIKTLERKIAVLQDQIKQIQAVVRIAERIEKGEESNEQPVDRALEELKNSDSDIEEEAAQTFADAGKADGSGKEFDWAFQAGEK
jgi:predicted RNase H-like nuclease (RuvC/YqgF family)